MKLGSKFIYFFIFFFLFLNPVSSEDKILSSPLINLDQIKPSFEELDDKNEIFISEDSIKVKKKINKNSISSHAILIGLDKITAKSLKIKVDLDEVKKFGPLEIKILKCGKVK